MTPFEIADALRSCLDAAYDTAGETVGDGKPAEICHRPGAEVPFSLGLGQDECCSGLGWVRIAGIDPVVDPQQAQDPDFNRCMPPQRRITLELGVARCNPYGTTNGGPDCDTWTALALRMDLDALRMRQAVCCFGDLPETGEGGTGAYQVMPGSWEPLEASGLCAGGLMTVVVWTDCAEC